MNIFVNREGMKKNIMGSSIFITKIHLLLTKESFLGPR
jgi:hypothetical protein